MARAVVFTYAIANGLAPVVGAAPFDVLARQLPRALVARLNDGDDRGVRFFPFLGPVDGVRSFLRIAEMLDPKALMALHQQGEVELLVDGLLQAGQLTCRVLDGASGKERLRFELPFDPREPLAVLPRLEFELVGVLGWSGRPSEPPSLSGEALGWLLVLRDELLRHEANLPDASPDLLRAARRCVELEPADDEVQQLVLEFVALLLRRKREPEACAEVLLALAQSVADPKRLDRLAGMLFAAERRDDAARLLLAAASAMPEQAELVERAATLAFQVGNDEGVQRVLGAARAAGVATPKMIAQLAASYDRSGDHHRRRELVDELVGHDDLPVPVARLVVTFLLDEGQPALARTVLERALQVAPEHAMLHYELGRASLLLDDVPRASLALQRSLDLGLATGIESQARRLLRLSLVPGLWQGSQLVEKAIAKDELGAALEAARALVRRVGPVAEAWLMFGIVQHKRGRLRRAERLLRRALRYHEACADAHNRLGVVLLQTGRVASGLTELRRAHELAPDDTSTLLHLAQAAALSGQHEQAVEHVDDAARLGADPQLVEAVRRELGSARDSA